MTRFAAVVLGLGGLPLLAAQDPPPKAVPGQPAKPVDLPPYMAKAKVEKDALVVSDVTFVTVQKEGTRKVAKGGGFVDEKFTYTESVPEAVTRSLPLARVKATDRAGRVIPAARLGRLLAREAAVAVNTGPTAEEYRAAFKEDVVFLELPDQGPPDGPPVPDGPPPGPPGVWLVDAKVERDQFVRELAVPVPVKKVVKAAVNEGGVLKEVDREVTVVEFVMQKVGVPVKGLRATDAAGRPIPAARLAGLLAAETTVVMHAGPLADKHRKLYKDGTVFVEEPPPAVAPDEMPKGPAGKPEPLPKN